MPRLDLIALGVREGLRRALASTALTVMRRELRDAIDGNADEPTWAARWYDALRPIIDVIMQAAVDRDADKLGPFDHSTYLHEYTSELSRNLARTSFNRVMRLTRESFELGEGPDALARRLRAELPELNKTRSELIARTELHTAAEAASYQQAMQSPVVSRAEWHHSGKRDARPEHIVLDRTTVPLGTPFPTGEVYPNRPNCGCYLTFE